MGKYLKKISEFSNEQITNDYLPNIFLTNNDDIIYSFGYSNISISKYGVASYYTDKPIYVNPNDNLKFYICEQGCLNSQGKIDLTEIYDGEIIPPNTGLFIKGTQGNYKLLHIYNKKRKYFDVSKNILRGSIEPEYIQGPGYVLAVVNGIAELHAVALNKDANGNAGTTHFLNNPYKCYLLKADI